MTDPRPTIRALALEAGFDAVGFARVDRPWKAGERLADFVALGRHGSMTWMEDTLQRRMHPQNMWPGARSAVSLGMSYGPDTNPMQALEDRTRGAISVYAQGDDYHEVVKSRLKRLARGMQERFGGEVKVFVDTAPLMEKPLAEAAGLGWQGKHTNLVSREHGSWLFLGSILTSLELEADGEKGEHCGSCRACLDICPTNAFPAPFQLDARACLSYLTIESRAPMPVQYRAAMGNRIYGCDDCLAVCPWNKFAGEAQVAALHARDHLRSPPLEELAALDDAAFRALFTKSPVKRIGRDRFVRNVLYAIGNSGEPRLAPDAARLLDDPSPLVRGAAAWACWRLMDADAFEALRAERASVETDVEVRREWFPSPLEGEGGGGAAG
ncbi:MAG: tRNA epoxyqueuosine(34) reductase QueG [Caulobacterales bacterium 32-69-10]|nr:MAG: tRNA epoxyqueuosine(34) reductase QueG [Caulobacterales bacterium 32-69-10]